MLAGVVYVVDDDASVREALSSLTRSIGLEVEVFGTADEFLARERTAEPACVVLDVRLPGADGLALQRELAGNERAIPIVFITGHGDIRMSVAVAPCPVADSEETLPVWIAHCDAWRRELIELTGRPVRLDWLDPDRC